MYTCILIKQISMNVLKVHTIVMVTVTTLMAVSLVAAQESTASLTMGNPVPVSAWRS